MINIFISYSHVDEIFKDNIDKHLTLLKRNNIIETWNDRKIIPGQEWDAIIRKELSDADIILLLISIDFLNSDYCYDIEIKKALEKHENKEAIVIPIILRACSWKETIFGKLQALPIDGRPVSSYGNPDEAYHSISEALKKTIEEFGKNKSLNNNKSENTENKIDIIHKSLKECDTPPNISYWTGRNNEIDSITSGNHKVILISGIGGQGKSGLASHYVKEIVPKSDHWEFWDWRDCQEKENRIHTKIISIICRLSHYSIKSNQISEENIDDLIDLFFEKLEKRNIVFVFDNIDAYVEFETFQLIGAIEKLYSAALRENHNSKFIFTSRSTINDIHPDLLQIKLHGLSKDETAQLFNRYNFSLTNEKIKLLTDKSFDLTKGHPLWLNLIAAQAKRGFEVVEDFLSGIKTSSNFKETDFASILSNKILNVIWAGLNNKQKILLRALAETVRSETLDILKVILSPELSNNQFTKCFKVLRQLNLIETKSSPNEPDLFELHPLVREYIVHNFGRTERSKYISLFVKYYDNIILVLKPKLSPEQPLSFFENWTAKIELAINKDDYKNALISLQEISDPICEAGYNEEYIRVANLLFTTIDWASAINEEYSYFHTQFSDFISTITDFGKSSEAKAYLFKYNKHILNKGVNFIRYCKDKSYYHWFNGEFDEAIKIAESGVLLESQSETKSGLNLENTLALALRDTKIPSNIEKALDIFLNENKIEPIINSKDDLHIAGEIFGNIGRCLQFLGQNDDAIKCYKKSLKILTNSMNKGYGFFWISEILLEKHEISTSIWFLIHAKNIWVQNSPVKANMLKKKIDAIIEIHPSYEDISLKDKTEIEIFCNNWIK